MSSRHTIQMIRSFALALYFGLGLAGVAILVLRQIGAL